MNRRWRRTEMSALAADLALPSLAALRQVSQESERPGQRASRPAPPCFLGGARVIAIRGDVATLGRALHNTVVIVDPSVSREHAHLRSTEAGWSVTNVSAREALWVGEQRMSPGGETPLSPGEMLRLGKVTLQLLAPQRLGPPASPERTVEEETVSPNAALAATTSSGTHVLAPGITLQFAAEAARRSPRWRLIGAALLLVALVSAMFTLGIAVAAGASAASGGLWRVLAALTVPVAPVVGAALVVIALDRYEREPVLVLAGAFVWGALIAIAPALLVERGVSELALSLLHGGGISTAVAEAAAKAITAGVIEEGIKGVGLLLLLLALRDEFDNVTDGILYGLLIGAGFALVENFAYVAASPRGDLPFLIFGRIVLGWLSHSTFTALFGAGLGYVRETRGGHWRWLFLLAGAAASILLHTWFDFVALATTALAHTGTAAGHVQALALVSVTLAYLPLFAAQALLLGLVIAALGREAETIRVYLAPEVIGGAVSADEYVLLQDARLRGWAERRVFLEVGWRAYLTARALHQAATGLAFWKWHAAMDGTVPSREPVGRAQREQAYHDRIARLRRSLTRQLTAALLDDRADG